MTDPNARPSVDAGGEPESPELSAQPAEQPIDPADLARDAAEYKDKLLRTLAEMENLRRRTEREVADSPRSTASPPSRAISSPSPTTWTARCSARRGTAREGGRRHQGAARRRRADRARAAQGAGEARREEIRAAGREIRSQPASGDVRGGRSRRVPAGTVAQVVQPGYMIGERVLRPALVAVAKGGPKPPAAEGPANDNA